MIVNERVLALVDRKWRSAFLQFVNTCEAPQGFVNYLDSDPRCQAALDMLVDDETELLREAAALIKQEVIAAYGTEPGLSKASFRI